MMRTVNTLRLFICSILTVLSGVLISTIVFGCQAASQDKPDDKVALHPENGTPAWLVDMYFNQKEFPDKANFYTGEMKSRREQPTIGAQKYDDVVTTYRLLEDDSVHSVFAVNLSSPRESDDIYCFMINENKIWKIQAIRGLWVPGFFYETNDMLSRRPDLPDSLREDVDRFNLMTSTDSTLKQYLRENIEQFRELVATVLDQHKDVKPLLKQLRASHAYTSNGCVFVVIERIIDNSAGYFYAPPGATLPKMSSRDYIYIEEVLPNWFVFKTT